MSLLILVLVFVVWSSDGHARRLHSFPTRRSSDLEAQGDDNVHVVVVTGSGRAFCAGGDVGRMGEGAPSPCGRSEEHTSELQSPDQLVCRLLLEKTFAGILCIVMSSLAPSLMGRSK